MHSLRDKEYTGRFKATMQAINKAIYTVSKRRVGNYSNKNLKPSRIEVLTYLFDGT
jgi:transcription initiation factor IIE alpha subunit